MLLSALVICSAGVQASGEFKYPEHSKKGITERAIHRNQTEMQKIVYIIDSLTHVDEECSFENATHDYFGLVSYEAEEIVKLYDSYAPTDEHVQAIELYALMFKAFANAAKRVEDRDPQLLNEAKAKIPDLIKLAEKLVEDCKASIEKWTPKMNEE